MARTAADWEIETPPERGLPTISRAGGGVARARGARRHDATGPQVARPLSGRRVISSCPGHLATTSSGKPYAAAAATACPERLVAVVGGDRAPADPAPRAERESRSRAMHRRRARGGLSP